MKKSALGLSMMFFLLESSALYADNNHGISINGKSLSSFQRGSGVVKTKQATLKEFSRIDSDVSLDIVIEKAQSYDYTLRADDNLLNIVELVSDGNTLKIRTNKSYQTNSEMKLHIRTKNLKSLKLDGSSNVALKNLNENALSIEIDGSVDVSALNGRVESLSVKADGAYDVNFKSLKVQKANVVLSGSGDVGLNVSKNISGSVEDSASLSYLGGAKVNVSVEDSADVDKID